MQDLEGQNMIFTRLMNFNSKTHFKETKKDISQNKEKIYEINTLKISELLINKFIDLFQSNCHVISYFYNIIKSIYQNKDITEEEIKYYLIDYMKKSKIYIVHMKEDINGITLFNGNIYINKKYLDIMKYNNPYENISSFYLTIFHELIHTFLREIKDRDCNLNNKFDDKNNNSGNNIITNNKEFIINKNFDEFAKKCNKFFLFNNYINRDMEKRNI